MKAARRSAVVIVALLVPGSALGQTGPPAMVPYDTDGVVVPGVAAYVPDGTAVGAGPCEDLTEGFPDPLGGWTTRWVYLNSNLENYYVAVGNCDINNRGNNPIGLWIAEPQGCGSGTGGAVMNWVFDAGFAATLTHLEFGIEAFSSCDITIYDVSNNVLSSATYVNGGFDFDHADIVSADSTNGISRVEFNCTPYGHDVEGWTSIDNVLVTTCPAVPGCLEVVSENINCHSDGTTFTWDVEAINLCTGDNMLFSFTGSGGAVGEELCFTVTINDDDGLCCTTELCVTIPDCSKAASSCPWDLDGDGTVGIVDFLMLLAAWGPNPGQPADFDGDGVVSITDFLELLANWGDCP